MMNEIFLIALAGLGLAAFVIHALTKERDETLQARVPSRHRDDKNTSDRT